MEDSAAPCEMKGIIVATPAGLNSNGKITYDPTIQHINACIKEGVHGFWINGCTGLALYLSESEREDLAEMAIKQIAGRVPTWVHVGAYDTAQSCRLAEHARESGAVGISSLPPLFYNTNMDQIVNHLTAIQKAADLPITYYHLPALTRVQLDANQLIDLCRRVPNVQAIKYSDLDLLKAMLIRERLPHVKMMTGFEEILLGGLALGCFDGTVGAGQNFAPGPLVDVYNACHEGDFDRARGIQRKLVQLFSILDSFDFTAASYAFLKLCGFDFGHPRLPMQVLSSADCQRIGERVLRVVKPDPFEQQRLIRSGDLLDEMRDD